ncbi:MAG: 50S ribosomal protein L17 [Candidatus Eisenbacteria bacterium]|nr:50S ribosomal protein L17 [Candidatus Latescibacterota bacterium]MBD3301349.1 50S ribosomal protein L17 [Candidatus Eisenbacteria bacterium]
MRHHRDFKQLSRTAEHRRALMRNLVTALFEYERIETTVTKAKEARRVAERMITYAKRDNLHARRLVARTVQKEDVAKKLFDTITPWYATREGGYTRILKTRRRLGDGGELAILELVKSAEQREADRKARMEKAEKDAEKKEKRKKEKEAMEGPAPPPGAPAATATETAEEEAPPEKPKKERKPAESKEKREKRKKEPKKGSGFFSRFRKGKSDRSG